MTQQPDGDHRAAPRWAGLLLIAYAAHVCEEWWGGPGFSAWTHQVLGMEVSPSRFIAINAGGLLLFAVGIAAAIRSNRFGWIAAALAALLFLNGTLHLLATVGFATYSPGTVTGVLLYLPLGGLMLRRMSRVLPERVLLRSVMAGVVAHALVALAAFA